MTHDRESVFRSALQDRPAILFDEGDSLESYAAVFGLRNTPADHHVDHDRQHGNSPVE